MRWVGRGEGRGCPRIGRGRGTSRAVVNPAEDRATDIGWIVEHAVDRRRIPSSSALPRLATHSFQTAADFAHACSLQTDPGENQADDVSFLLDDFEALHPAAQVATDIAVSKGSAS